MKLNKHYSELNESYLFSTIAHKVAAYQKANPDKDIIRLGIGDVTLPLAKSVTDAMLKAVEEQGKKETFHGYIPSEQGYEFLRSAIQKYYAGHGVELDMAEIFVSDGAKSDLGNLLDLFDVDNTVLVPDPVYPVYVDDNVMAGRKILYMSASAENNFLPMPDDNVHADIVYLCSPNNPTGATYTVDQLKEWVRWAKANNALIEEAKANISQQMIDDDCPSISVGGFKFTLTPKTIYSKKSEAELASEGINFFETLREEGLGDIIVESVNTRTLQSTITAYVAENDGLSEDLAKCISIFDTYDITRRRESSRATKGGKK